MNHNIKGITAQELDNIHIKASKQKPGEGCMWHSIYALTNNLEFLKYTHISCAPKFMIIVQSHGYLLFPWLATPPKVEKNITLIDLNELTYKRLYDIGKKVQKSNLKLLFSCIMNGHQFHTIAVEGNFIDNRMKVMDPIKGSIQEDISWEDLFLSEYKAIYEILLVDSGWEEDYPDGVKTSE